MQEAHDIPLINLYRALGVDEAMLEKAVDCNRAVFLEHYEDKCDRSSLRDGAADLLLSLMYNGTANLIVSNHYTSQIMRILKQRDIHAHFHHVLAYDLHEVYPARARKGEKLRQYLLAQNWQGERAIIVGDTVEEIEIARDMGMASVAITGGLHSERRLRAARPDHVAHSLHDAHRFMQERGFAL
jgi:phosphoglycolate phosphatase